MFTTSPNHRQRRQPPKRGRSGRADAGWYTARELAELFGCTTTYIKQAILSLVDGEAKRKSQRAGRPMLYHGRKVLDAWLESRVHKMRIGTTTAGTVDAELMAGAMTPALEEYRRVRTMRERLKHEQDLQMWIRREDVHTGYAVIASILRSAGETLQTQFGPDALAILEAALNDADRELVTRFSKVEPNAGDNDEKAKN